MLYSRILHVDKKWIWCDDLLLSENGARITLFQQTGYGTVDKPDGENWRSESSGDFEDGLECV